MFSLAHPTLSGAVYFYSDHTAARNRADPRISANSAHSFIWEHPRASFSRVDVFLSRKLMAALPTTSYTQFFFGTVVRLFWQIKTDRQA
jgi:hypothetical protein